MCWRHFYDIWGQGFRVETVRIIVLIWSDYSDCGMNNDALKACPAVHTSIQLCVSDISSDFRCTATTSAPSWATKTPMAVNVIVGMDLYMYLPLVTVQIISVATCTHSNLETPNASFSWMSRDNNVARLHLKQKCKRIRSRLINEAHCCQVMSGRKLHLSVLKGACRCEPWIENGAGKKRKGRNVGCS